MKQPTPEQFKKEDEALEKLVEAVAELGWVVAIPAASDDEECPGLIVGEASYVEKITDALEQVYGDDPFWKSDVH